MKKILLIHGPNLNLLGERQASIYGLQNSEAIIQNLKQEFPQVDLHYFQSNNENELIHAVHEARLNYNGLLINGGAFSHTSLALADAVRSIQIPCISIHISNIYQREAYRHVDILADACQGSIVGLGTEGYALALECLLEKI